jgi:hypothetical protein
LIGQYEIPNPVRRRRAGLVYLVGAMLTAAGIVIGLPEGMWLAVALLAAIGGYHLLAGHNLAIKDSEALTIANAATDFPVGHASAVLGFDGVLARPTWNVLVFSADEPPTQRGLVRVNGRSGDVIETYTEVVPPAEHAPTGAG